MNCYPLTGLSLSMALLSGAALAQQATEPPPRANQVEISSTITGNQEQPRTLYVLPWQDSIAQIRIPAPTVQVAPEPIQPLDRQHFLRFIQAQSLNQQPATTASTTDN